MSKQEQNTGKQEFDHSRFFDIFGDDDWVQEDGSIEQTDDGIKPEVARAANAKPDSKMVKVVSEDTELGEVVEYVSESELKREQKELEAWKAKQEAKMKNEDTIYINEACLGEPTENQMDRMIELLRDRDWDVKYGSPGLSGDVDPNHDDSVASDLQVDWEQDWSECLDIISQEKDPVLQSVMTAAEAANEFGLAESTVRQACNRGTISARKSAGTWLILRADAEKKWNSVYEIFIEIDTVDENLQFTKTRRMLSWSRDHKVARANWRYYNIRHRADATGAYWGYDHVTLVAIGDALYDASRHTSELEVTKDSDNLA